MEVTDQHRAQQRRKRRKVIVAVLVLALAAMAASALGFNVGGGLANIWANATTVPLRFVVLACALRAAEAALIAVSWRSVLRATYPDSGISFKATLGAYQGSVGINAVTPAKAGTWVMLGLYRLAIPGSGLATLLATVVVQGLPFTVITVLTYVLGFRSQRGEVRSPSHLFEQIGAYVAAHPALTGLIVLAVLALLLLTARIFWAKVSDLGQQIALAGAILRTPLRYLLGVVLPAALSFVCHCGVIASFLAAFGIPVSPQTVFLVASAHSLSSTVQVTPGGLGTTQALDVIALRGYASAAIATDFSLAQQAILLVFNVLFSIIALAWGFGWSETLTVVQHRKQFSAQVEAEATQGRDSEGRGDSASISPENRGGTGAAGTVT